MNNLESKNREGLDAKQKLLDNSSPLSDDLPILEAEIKMHQQSAGRSIFEIGRRLNKIKDKNMVHGEWLDWLSDMNIGYDFAAKSMRIAKKFVKSDPATMQLLEGKSTRVLTELTSLPDKILNETFAVNGEMKKPFDMSSNELRDLKKKLRETEQKYLKAQSRAHETSVELDQVSQTLEDREQNLVDLSAKYANLKAKKQEVKTEIKYEDRIVEKEVPPKDYNKIKEKAQRLEILYDQSKERLREMETQYKKEIASLQAVVNDSASLDEEVERAKEQLIAVQQKLHEANQDIVGVENLEEATKRIKNFLYEIAPYIYSKSIQRLDPDSFVVQSYADLAFQVQEIGYALVSNIPGHDKKENIKMASANVIEGEFDEDGK